MNRNLLNQDSDDILNGFQIIGQPTGNNQVLLYNNGSFYYASVSPGGGIVSVVSVGSGQSIIESLSSGVLSLKSFVAGANMICSGSVNEISYGLSNNLTNINSIESSSNFFDIIITDNGLSQPKVLRFNCTYGILTSSPLEINNQGQIFLSGIVTGTPNNSEFLALDINGKLIKAPVNANVNIQNVGGGNTIYKNESPLDTYNFKTLNSDTNINLVEPSPDLIEIQLNSDIDISSINGAHGDLSIDAYDIQLPYIGAATDLTASTNICMDNTGQLRYTDFLNNVSSINRTRAFTTMVIYNEEVQLQNIQPTPGLKHNVMINNNILYTGYSLNYLNNAGTNNLIKSNTIDTDGTVVLKGLANSTSTTINSLTNDLSISVNASQPQITSIGQSGQSLAINSTTTSIPNLPSYSITLDDVVGINGGVLTRATRLNNISQIAGTSLGISAATINIPNIPSGTAAFNLSIDGAGNIIKTTGVIGTLNIYNTDGQMTSATRILTGLTPGGNIANKLQLNGLTLQLANNIVYDPNNLSISGGNEFILAGDSNITRAITRPYSRWSRRQTVQVPGGFGGYRDFCSYTLSSVANNIFFKIFVHETAIFAGNDIYSAQFDINLNFNNVVIGTVYTVKPSKCNPSTNGVNRNYLNFEFYLGIGGVLTMRLKNAGQSGFTNDYDIAMYYYGADNQITNYVSITAISGISNLSQNVFNRVIQPINMTGIGAPPSLLFNYNYGKDIIVNFSQVINAIAGSGNNPCNLSINLNGNLIVNHQIFTLNNDRPVAANIRQFLSYTDLLNTNALNINTSNTMTFTLTGVNANKYNFTNQPYRVMLEFV